MNREIKEKFMKEIQDDLNKARDRFEIHDPRYSSISYKNTSSEATIAADKQGIRRISHISPESKSTLIEKSEERDGKWYVDGNKTIEEIQSNIDGNNLARIKKRSEKLASLTGTDKEIDILKAKADLADIKRIQGEDARQEAVKIMGESFNKKSSDNAIEPEEILKPKNSSEKALIPEDIAKKYIRVDNKYYLDSGGSPNSKTFMKAAFIDKGNKLETQSNDEKTVNSLVRIAEARGWKEIKVSGSESFRKEAWLEANSRGIKVKGYVPQDQDKAVLQKRTEDMGKNEKNLEKNVPSIHQKRAEAWAQKDALEAVKKYPELASAAALAAVIDKKAKADGLSPEARKIVAERTRQNIINSIERGNVPEVKIREDIEVSKNKRKEKEPELVR